jgi:hypothetical protein
MNKSILGLMGIALMAIGGTGCIAGTGEEGEEGSDDEVEVGEASDAFSEVYFWSTGSTVADSWGIGAKAGTGFLMGLSGNIGNGGATAAFASAGESVSQLVWEHNPVGGRALGSWVGTVQPPLNGSTGETIIKNFPSTTSGSSTVDLEAKVFGANRRCFLTAVRNNNSNHNAFQAVGDAIEILDVANNFHGCIAGCHEVLRRQGLLEGTWCLDPGEGLSPGQREAIDRVCREHADLADDDFVAEHLPRWLD